jgi:hypothetical protein
MSTFGVNQMMLIIQRWSLGTFTGKSGSFLFAVFNRVLETANSIGGMCSSFILSPIGGSGTH